MEEFRGQEQNRHPKRKRSKQEFYKFSFHKKYEVEVNLIEKYNALSKTFSPTSNINDISF